MGHDSAENTGQISGSEGHSELGSIGVFRLGLGEYFFIHLFNNGLEGNEFDNGVRNLSSPQGSKGLE